MNIQSCIRFNKFSFMLFFLVILITIFFIFTETSMGMTTSTSTNLNSKISKFGNNIFDVLSTKYSSMIPSLTSKYGEFAKPFNWIYKEDDFSRMDESNDNEFYKEPRLVHHIDESARNSLTNFYSFVINHELNRLSVSSINMLDICSSWVTHYPDNMIKNNIINVKGIGMNKIELSKNNAFKSENDYLIQDLNINPIINNKFASNDSFDIITITVSIDYLINIRKLINEILRILKPNGLLMLSFSNRMFWTKAFKIWTKADENKRVYIAFIVSCYEGRMF